MLCKMLSLIYVLSAATMLTWCSAEVNREEYLYWRRDEISAYHQYFSRRLLEGERLTNEKATAAVPILLDGLSDSLQSIVKYQRQELETAQLMMEGSSAQGCVQGIANNLNNAIDEEISKFEDCSADALPQLKRLSSSWNKTNADYMSVYNRVMNGIDQCNRTYPNRDSLGRLKNCLDSWNKTYFAAVSYITNRYISRPSMSVFEVLCVGCAEAAAVEVINKGWKFLNMLVQCARLSENIDAEMYALELQNGYSSYSVPIDLRSQIMDARSDYVDTVSLIEEQMQTYYALQKSTLESYVIESRGFDFYSSQLRAFLRAYFNTVTGTSYDNPSAANCANNAFNELSAIVNEGASIALRDDLEIVNNTCYLIATVNHEFQGINEALPHVGDVAVIDCFDKGYIFAESTIRECCLVVSGGFGLYLADVKTRVERDVAQLYGYEGFFSNSSLPCAESLLRRAAWGADRVLYGLQRCLYVSTGTRYAVTTPAYTTTTSVPSR